MTEVLYYLSPSLIWDPSVPTVLTVAAVYGHMKKPMKTLCVDPCHLPYKLNIDVFLAQVGSWEESYALGAHR